MEIDESTLSQEVRGKLALRRSRVRIFISIGAFIVVSIMFLWGMMWMSDRSIAIAGIVLYGNILAYWFGSRNNVSMPKI